ncbi:MAG: c-type cytochrome domain-containing protein [Isosphaeraceae bacterium]
MRFLLPVVFSMTASTGLAAGAPAPDFATQVAPIFQKYCIGCHNDAEPEGDFSLQSYRSLRKGSPRGPVFKAGRAEESRLFRQLTGASKPIMPPKGEPRPNAEEIALIKAWIDAGADGPTGEPADRLALAVPGIGSRSQLRPITALQASRDGKWLATARYAAVEVQRLSDEGGILEGHPARVLRDFPGKVTAVHFSADGSRLVTASGVAGLGGVAALWNMADGSLIRKFDGHADLLFDAELSPDGKTLATCGYDKVIRLWAVDDGRPLRSLAGHNGAVYDLDFSPDGRFLVSASADDTCKVWRVEDGQRMDTLPQPLKEEYSCAFSPDGRHIVAGGADNMIRVWEFVSRDRPSINPMVLARYAHEGSIVSLAFTPDGSRLVSTAEDRTVKLWETSGYTELQLWDRQPDVVIGVALAGDARSFRVGRMDGSTGRYTLPTPHELSAPIPADPFAASIRVADRGEMGRDSEREPNDAVVQANDVEAPVEIAGTITGRIADGADADLFRFSARAGEPWVIEVDAARSGSKLDSFVEVLDSRGRRIERVLLQAVLDSYFAFRGKDDTSVNDFRLFNWEEMHLDEFLYANGEVARLWLYPRGPDSGFVVYPGKGARWGHFDTTPLSHALGEPCYIVRPHPPGSDLIPNGLPVFPLFFENDDESHRELGKDSKLEFIAPADGRYLVKIKDVRGSEGPDYKYTLKIRPRRPDFRVTLEGPKAPIVPGGAQEFRVSAKRIDGFDGPIRVEIDGLPPGFSATTPLIIEAGQIEALGVIAARTGAAAPTPEQSRGIRVVASATISGRDLSHPVNPLGSIRLASKPALLMQIGPAEEGPRPILDASGRPSEYELHPGQTIMLKVKVQRNGHVGPVPLGNEGSGRNLPFGVIVDNLGLNGLLITEDQQERTFFITADRSVRPQTRAFHLTTTVAGGQSSLPVILHVR